jgi:hypothetical protein
MRARRRYGRESKRSWKIRLPWKIWYLPVARIFRKSPIFHAKFEAALVERRRMGGVGFVGGE